MLLSPFLIYLMITAGRGIYIGRLPYDITKQGIVEVVKKFGPVRRNADTIQIRRHEVCSRLIFTLVFDFSSSP